MTRNIDRRALLAGGVGMAAGAALGWLAARPWSPRAHAEETSPGHEDRLKKLKLELPELKPSKGATIVPAVRAGDMLYLSGHIPYKDGKLVTGKLGKDLDAAQGAEAARLIGLTVLAVLRAEL